MVSLVTGNFTSESCLPTSLQSSVRLSQFPGDTRHESGLNRDVKRLEFDQLWCPEEPNFYPRRRNSWSGSEVLDESEDDLLSGVLEEDLEKGSALTAASVVVFITVTFFSVMITMLSFTLSVAGDYQAIHGK